MITKKATLLVDIQCALGEGPIWDWKNQMLYWIDVTGGKLHQYNPKLNAHKHWVFQEMLGASVLMKSGDMLLSLASGIVSFNIENATLSTCLALENKNNKLRFNDGKVDSSGNFWVGTMNKDGEQDAGNLFRITPELKSTIQIPKTTIANGMAWTANQKTFYFIDSPNLCVMAYDYTLEKGLVGHGKKVITVPETYGYPDGMCIDEEGMLWIAHWNGSCIRRWNPITGKVEETVMVDAPHVTSCCFGGPDFKTLFITTAREGLTKQQLEKKPNSGSVFTYKTNVKGFPVTYF